MTQISGDQKRETDQRVHSSLEPASIGIQQAECPKHGKYLGGTIVFAGGRKVSAPCPECIRVESVRNATRQANEALHAGKVAELEAKLGRAGIPKRFLKCSLDNFEVRDDRQKQVLAFVRSFVDNLPDNLDEGRGLVLIGPPGVGKTHLAAAVCRATVELGRAALFMDVLEAVQYIRDAYKAGSEKSERELMADLVSPDLLVLDEVGVQHETRHELTTLTELINQRYAAQRSTIFMGNKTMAEIRELLGDRVNRRIRETCQILPCTWQPHRPETVR